MENVEIIEDQKSSNFKRDDSNVQNGMRYVRKQCKLQKGLLFLVEQNIILKLFILTGIEMFLKSKKSFTDGEIYKQMKYVVDYLLSNPLLLFGMIIVSTVFIVPIALFSVFIIINVAVAFVSFIIVEGNELDKSILFYFILN